jgi:uncharacterized membrane protein
MTQRFKLNGLLLASVLFCIGFVAVRIYFSGALSYSFLLWNLFLAFIPFVLSSLLVSLPSPSALVFWLLGAIWLMFFPNAPYVLTDLLHLKAGMVPVWYDLLMLLSFAWTSLMLGFVSLADMQALIARRFNPRMGWVFAFMALLLGSFGIYLGRFLRWNSWDLITQPTELLLDIVDRVINPLAHLKTYGFTLLLTVFLLLAYLMMHFFNLGILSPETQRHRKN